MLEADKEAHRKQRHTAHRVYTRREEHPGCEIGESTIRRYVRQRRFEMGLAKQELFVPQGYGWGQEAQGRLVRSEDEVRRRVSDIASLCHAQYGVR